MFWIKVLAPVFRLKTRKEQGGSLCFEINSKRYIQRFLETVFIFTAVLTLSKRAHANHSSRRSRFLPRVLLLCKQSSFLYPRWTTFLTMMAAIVPAATIADKQRILSYRLVAEGPFARDNNVQPVEKRQSSLFPFSLSLSLSLLARSPPLFRHFPSRISLRFPLSLRHAAKVSRTPWRSSLQKLAASSSYRG